MAEEEVEEPKRKGSLLKIILFVVGGLLLLGLGAGGGFFVTTMMTPPEPPADAVAAAEKAPVAPEPKKPEKIAKDDVAESSEEEDCDPDDEGCEKEKPLELEAKPFPDPERFKTSYHEIEKDFTSNLKNSRRYIQARLGVSTHYDERVFENLEKHILAVQSAIVTVLADQTEEDVSGIEGKEQLQKKLAVAINNVLIRKEDFGGIEEVLFLSFVLQ